MRYWFLGGGIFLLDRFTKWGVLQLHREVVWNNGGAWGMGARWGFYGFVPLILLFFGLFYGRSLWQDSSFISKHALVLILAGAMGNIFDRYLWGSVLDWIVVFGWFPWFNFADVGICIGVGLLLLDIVYFGGTTYEHK